MTEPLDAARFQALADAYGAVILRWPEAERADAMRLSREPAMRAILSEAAALDEGLDSWSVPAPTPALTARIAHAAPRPRTGPWQRARLWWSGLGLAAALAGAAAGSAVAGTLGPAPISMDNGTAFGVIDPGDAQ